MDKKEIGKIGWIDLTVPDAGKVKDFYKEVIGWEVSEFPVADYVDYCVAPQEGEAVAGICHQRGANAEIPSQWLMYIAVADLDASIEACKRLGGELVTQPRDMGGYGKMCVLRDPAGAVSAIMQPPESND